MPSKTLKGVAWPSGQIEFSRHENDWAFARIKEGMHEGQENSIRVNPSVASFELVAAHRDNNETDVPWMQDVDRLLKTADRVYLEYHGDFLRFRRAIHEINMYRRFITLGSQQAVNDFFSDTVGKVKYFFAHRRDATFFELESVIDYSAQGRKLDTRPIELNGRMNISDENPVIVFSASGAHAPMEVVEWRSNIKIGDRGRFNWDDSHIELSVNNVCRPWTIYREHRDEFRNHCYTLSAVKFKSKLEKFVEQKLRALERQAAAD